MAKEDDMEVTGTDVSKQEQIIIDKVAALKKEHKIKEVFVIVSDDKIAYLKKPSRAQLAYAMTLAQSNPLGMTEEILKSGWLDGDEELQTDDKYFLSISSQIDSLIETTQVSIKKY
jgi:hypothetical protein